MRYTNLKLQISKIWWLLRWAKCKNRLRTLKYPRKKGYRSSDIHSNELQIKSKFLITARAKRGLSSWLREQRQRDVEKVNGRLGVPNPQSSSYETVPYPLFPSPVQYTHAPTHACDCDCSWCKSKGWNWGREGVVSLLVYKRREKGGGQSATPVDYSKAEDSILTYHLPQTEVQGELK